MRRSDPRHHLPDGRTRLLGILGDPLEHSLSPRLHTAVLRRLDRNLIYVPVPVSAARLGRFLRIAGDLGFLGCNVTTPFKEAVLRWAEPGDRETRRTRMANTLRFGRAGRPEAIGTDGRGVLAWMESAGLAGRPFGVLGFGATARSLVHAAWAAGTPPAVVCTRRPGPVRRTLGRWAAEPGRGALRGDPPAVVGGDAARPGPGGPVEVWVSTWPPGAHPGEGFWSRLPRGAVLLDMNYGSGRATMADAARGRGVAAADGLGPLLAQAALSLSHWLGEPVAPDLFRAALGVAARDLRPRR